MNFYLPKIQKYDSLDPFLGDRLNNALAQRMVHSTLLEVDSKNRLVSSLLSKFEYQSDQKKIVFILNTSSKFSDGTPVTVKDILLPILRMSRHRTDFPVIRDIVGLKEWKNQNDFWKLPSGIKVTGKRIEISLEHGHDNPLFRFCLETFGVVPHQYFNLEANKFEEEAPRTGLFQIESSGNSETVFKRWREAPEHSASLPEKINFIYGSKKANSDQKPSVLFSTDFHLLEPGARSLLEGRQVISTPPSFFYGVLISPKMTPFDDPNCRKVFARELMQASGEVDFDLPIEFSLFPKILPGFLTREEVLSILEVEEDQRESCLHKFKGNLKWHSTGEHLFEELIAKTLERMGISHSGPQKVSRREEWIDLFAKGKTPFFRFGSGFWAQDPAGDLAMMLTPGMHDQLNFISSESTIRELVRKFRAGGSLSAKDFDRMNRLILDSGLMAVVRHFGFTYAFEPHVETTHLPLAVQMPYPWQLFLPYVQ